MAVVDLTGDGSYEIIMGRGGDKVTVYNASGQVLWERNPFKIEACGYDQHVG